MPRLPAYPLLGVTAGCLIWFGTATVVGWYYLFFFPVALLVAGLGVAAAREWNRPGQRAFVAGCLGVMLASVALIPFGTDPPIVLPFMSVGLVAGVGLSRWIKR